jgi:uncharacterized protein YciU (UPF0263 family)
VTPLTTEIGVDAGGEYEQHGEVAIAMTTEQADRLADVLAGLTITDTETMIFLRMLVAAIREARN